MTIVRNPEVGLVLAGGGARGAYEAGALTTLLPRLEERGELPGIVLGTSIGALNGTRLAATAHQSAVESVDSLLTLWRAIRFSDAIGPLVSPRELGRLLRYVGGILGIPTARVPAVLDTTRLADEIRSLVDLERLHDNIDAGLVSLAVVATSYATGDSVVFHDGPAGMAVQMDMKRGIRYVPTRIDIPHIHASASIPIAFQATKVETPVEVAGWYGDGGTRLNTPIKPALRLGAKRVVVIGLSSSAPPPTAEVTEPDVFDGAAQVTQALLADPLAQDVATLSSFNAEAGEVHPPVPYIFVAPPDRLAIGRLAAETFRTHLTGMRAMLRQRDLVALGHSIGAGNDAVRGELFSFLFFATEFHEALIELGRRDAERWLAIDHDDGPWRLGTPPLPAPPPAPTPAPKRRAKHRAAA